MPSPSALTTLLLFREDVWVALWYMKQYPTQRAAIVYWRELGYCFRPPTVWAVIGTLGSLSRRYFEAAAPAYLHDPAVSISCVVAAVEIAYECSLPQHYVPGLGASVIGAVDVFPWFGHGMRGRRSV